MRSSLLRVVSVVVLALTPWMAQAQDLKVSRKISVGGSSFTSDTYVKGARERNVMNMPGGMSNVTIHQCDLKRTLNVNDQSQSYLAVPDPTSDEANSAAALLGGAPVAQSGGKIILNTTIADTGERKQMFGFAARHLKTTVQADSAAGACSQVHQKFEIDGWYADVSKEQAGCAHLTPPMRPGETCHDQVVSHSSGKGKPGFPLAEKITIQNGDAQPLTMDFEVAAVSKDKLPADLFDVPVNYRQATTFAELYAPPPAAQVMAGTPAAGTPQAQVGSPTAYPAAPMAGNPMAMMNPEMMAQAQAAAMGMRPGAGIPGMPGAPAAGGTAIAAPQQLGPKAPGKIRIGVASPDAQVGQGTNSGMDYATPIRNVIIQYMTGPAVEVAAIGSRIPIQIQAEAQQKQCDYLLYSGVTVKHGGGGGFGRFMKMAGPATNVVPMVGMAKGMGAAAAASAASSAAAQAQALNSLANFNGQIKSKDEVTISYQLVAFGQQAPKLSNTLKAKATSDGQDVLSPLIQDLANTVLTEAAKK